MKRFAARTATPADSNVHVALLRGINVGGRHKLPMKSLVRLFDETGCRHVRTYIQSGNVVFEAPPALARLIPAAITRSISEHFGFEIPVVMRSADELGQIVNANPFQGPSTDERALHVAFLADWPDPTRIASLDPNRSSPDEFAVRGREIYLRFPDGVARTKLSNAYFDSRLATTSTVRNWRTTLKLLALAAGKT